MSAETITRWNAIPLNRMEPDHPPSLKRPRQDGQEADDESDDDVSLVSRSPSPSPDAMDVDKYDEYYKHSSAQEVITVETKIKNTNVGFSMLAKMGWVEGSPLGLSGDGRVDPVPFYVKNDLTGLGKTNQDVRMIESTVSQRREMDSERQTKETEEQRRQREDAVARRAAVQSEISTVLRPFYCEVCEKQFQNVAQYDEHTNSYAHHHKVRFRDMQAAQRASKNTDEEVSKRKEKERKREEKELRKIAKAAGIKMAKPPVAVVAPSPAANAAGVDEPRSSAFKKSGWATVATTVAATSAAPPELPKRSGWATVGETPSSSGAGGWAAVSAPPPPSSTAPPPPAPAENIVNGARKSYTGAPSFRTGGWTSLETSNDYLPPPALPQLVSAPPPPPLTAPATPPPPSFQNAHQGWTTTGPFAVSGWNSVSSSNGPPLPRRAPVPPPSLATVPPRPPPAQPARQESSRSGWQNFRAGAPGRRR